MAFEEYGELQQSTFQALRAAIADMHIWFGVAYGLSLTAIGRDEERRYDSSLTREVRALKEIKASLPILVLRLEHLEVAFDTHLIGVPAEAPWARSHAQSIRDALTDWRRHYVSVTATLGSAVDLAVENEAGVSDSGAAHFAAVLVTTQAAIRDVTGAGTLRLWRMIGRLDEKYGTSRGD